MVRRLFPLLLAAGCGGPSAPVATTTATTAAPPGPAPVPVPPATVGEPPGEPSDAGQPAAVPEALDLVATMTRPTLLRRVLPDGGLTRGGAEVLVVRRSGVVEIRDGDASGLVIKRATLDDGRVGRLVALLAQPAWAALPPSRGTPVPDGPSYEIAGGHHRITRFDRPDDEPTARRVLALLKAIWDEADR
jgi:hypothetical protein